MDQADRDTLEALVDKYTMEALLEAIADLCRDKAEHLQSNWQDHASARAWVRVAGKIDKLSMSVNF